MVPLTRGFRPKKKMTKNGQKMTKIGSEMAPKWPKIGQKVSLEGQNAQIDANTWLPRHQKWSKCRIVGLKGQKGPFGGQKWPFWDTKGLFFGLKMAKKWVKIAKKSFKTGSLGLEKVKYGFPDPKNSRSPHLFPSIMLPDPMYPAP